MRRTLSILALLTAAFVGLPSQEAAASPTGGEALISAGAHHTCGLVVDTGRVKCWGNNDYGQLGNRTTVSSTTPLEVSGITTAVSISAGSNHTCAVLADHTLRCWGEGAWGQLGNGATANASTPVRVSGIASATAVSAGDAHTCALLATGAVRCWGNNSFGQLGNGSSTVTFTTPVKVLGVATAASIGLGSAHSCATLADGGARCWGDNSYGQLGDGTTTSRRTPVAVSSLSGAQTVDGGGMHSCATLASGALSCWGYNAVGQLGNGTLSSSLVPVAVLDIDGATGVSAGSWHTCASLDDGTAWCWGMNMEGQIGSDSAQPMNPTPLQVQGLSNTQTVTAGGAHSCAVLTDDTAKCWGNNSNGQLGDGTTDASSVPVSVVQFP